MQSRQTFCLRKYMYATAGERDEREEEEREIVSTNIRTHTIPDVYLPCICAQSKHQSGNEISRLSHVMDGGIVTHFACMTERMDFIVSGEMIL